MLRAGHQELKLPDADVRRLAAWVDCDAVFRGSYDADESAERLALQPLPMPAIQ